MSGKKLDQWTIKKTDLGANLQTWVEAFLIDRRSQGMADGTLYFYRTKLKLFLDYCESNLIDQITQITPTHIREYMLVLESRGHNHGGRHACYRTLKTFLYWWEDEAEPEGWTNPIRKAKPPKVPVEQLEPADLDDVKAMIATCDRSILGLRDKSILLALLDTGARAAEFIHTKLEDVDRISGEIVIRQGKGGKFRKVFLGKSARRALRAYLKARSDDCAYTWVTREGEPLSYPGLRQIVRRRSELANVKTPSLHSFRRAFAINMLRAGVDVFSLQKLMGHADLQVLRRYLAQTSEDIAQAHRLGSPVDNNKL